MERIRMTKIDKLVLRGVYDLCDGHALPTNTRVWTRPIIDDLKKLYPKAPEELFYHSFMYLEENGLISVIRGVEKDYVPACAVITLKGLAYLYEYPKLENLEDPLRWERTNRILAYISVAVAVISACLSVIALIS